VTLFLYFRIVIIAVKTYYTIFYIVVG